MRVHPIAAAALLIAAGCANEITGIETVPAYVNWIEWPTAVSASQPGSLRVSGIASVRCGSFRVVFGVSVRGTAIHVTAHGVGNARGICLLDGGGTGAGADTVLPLPLLAPTPSGPPSTYAIFAPMMPFWSGAGEERSVGWLELRSTPDTAARFAGGVWLFTDSLGCVRARPYSAPPRPEWPFATPPKVVPGLWGLTGFLRGSLVDVNPPVCGQTRAIGAIELTVDATP